MKRVVLCGAAAVVAALAGCSSGNSGGVNKAGAGKAPECSSLIGDAKWAAKVASSGCLKDGSLQLSARFDCKGGWAFAYFGEHPTYYGLTNADLRTAVDPSNDPAYSQLFASCDKS